MKEKKMKEKEKKKWKEKEKKKGKEGEKWTELIRCCSFTRRPCGIDLLTIFLSCAIAICYKK